MGVALLDTNLLLLLIVGTASTNYINNHKRLAGYSIDDYDLLVLLLSQFSEIIIVPHVAAETSNLIRHISNPAKNHILNTFSKFIMTTQELPIESIHGARRNEFNDLGLADSVILHLCSLSIDDLQTTLITDDSPLANIANSLGYSVIDYQQDYLNS